MYSINYFKIMLIVMVAVMISVSVVGCNTVPGICADVEGTANTLKRLTMPWAEKANAAQRKRVQLDEQDRIDKAKKVLEDYTGKQTPDN